MKNFYGHKKPLEWSLRQEDTRLQLCAKAQAYGSWRLQSLYLDIPAFFWSNRDPKQLTVQSIDPHWRLSLSGLRLFLAKESCQRFLDERLAAHVDHGFRNVVLEWQKGYIVLAGQYKSVDFSMRLAVLPGRPGDIELVVYQSAIYGDLLEDWALLPLYLSQALDLPQSSCLAVGWWRHSLLKELLQVDFPMQGRKIPDSKLLAQLQVAIGPDGLWLEAGLQREEDDLLLEHAGHKQSPVAMAWQVREEMRSYADALLPMLQGQPEKTYDALNVILQEREDPQWLRELLLQLSGRLPSALETTSQLVQKRLQQEYHESSCYWLAAAAWRQQEFLVAYGLYERLEQQQTLPESLCQRLALQLAMGLSLWPVKQGQALLHCEKALNLSSYASDVVQRLYPLYLQTSAEKLALPLLENWLKRDLNPQQKLEWHCQAAALYHHQSRDLSKALWHYDKALQLQPSHTQALQGMAEIYVSRGDIHLAVQIFTELVYQAEIAEQTDLCVKLLLRLAQLYLHPLQQPNMAIGRLRRLIELQPKHAQALLYLAQQAALQNQTQKAQGYYADMIALDGDLQAETTPALLSQAYQELMALQASQTKSKASAVVVNEAYLQRALQLTPADKKLQQHFLKHLRQQGDCLALIEQLCRMAEDEAFAADEKERCQWFCEAAQLELYTLKKPKNARRILERLLATSAEDVTAAYLYVSVLCQLHDEAAYLKFIKEGLPEHLCLEEKAQFVWRLVQKHQEEPGYGLSSQPLQPLPLKQLYEQILQWAPNHHEAAWAYAKWYATQNQPQLAIECLEKLLRHSNKDVIVGETYWRLAQLYWQCEETSSSQSENHGHQALDLLHHAIEKQPKQIAAHLLKVEILQAQSQRCAALEALQRMEDLAVEQIPLALEEKAAWLYLQLEQHEQAFKRFRKLFSRGALPPRSHWQSCIKLWPMYGTLREASELLCHWEQQDILPAGEGYLLAASMYEAQSSLSEAAIYWQKALDSAQTAAAFYLDDFYQSQQQHEMSTKILAQALHQAKSQDRCQILWRRMQAEMRLQQHEAAIHSAEMILLEFPNHGLTHLALAKLYMQQGRFEAALLACWHMLLLQQPLEIAQAEHYKAFVLAAGLYLFQQQHKRFSTALLKEDPYQQHQKLLQRFVQCFPHASLDVLTTPLDRQLQLSAEEDLLERLYVEKLQHVAGHERSLTHEKLARLYDKKQQPLQALQHYDQAFLLRPNDKILAAHLVERLLCAHRYEEAIHTLFWQSQLSEDHDEAALAALAAALLAIRQGKDHALAHSCMHAMLLRSQQLMLPAWLDFLREQGFEAALAAVLEKHLYACKTFDSTTTQQWLALVEGPLQNKRYAYRMLLYLKDRFTQEETIWQWLLTLLQSHADLLFQEAQPAEEETFYHPYLRPHQGNYRHIAEVYLDWSTQKEDAEKIHLLSLAAESYQQSGCIVKSIDVLKQMVAYDPTVAAAHQLLKNHCIEQEDWLGALVASEHLLALAEGSRKDAILREMLQITQKHLPEHPKKRLWLERLSHRSASEEFDLLRCLMDLGLYHEVVKRQGDLPRLQDQQLWQVAMGLVQDKAFSTARLVLQILLERPSQRADAWRWIERLWQEAGQWQELAQWRLAEAEHGSLEEMSRQRFLAHAELLYARKNHGDLAWETHQAWLDSYDFNDDVAVAWGLLIIARAYAKLSYLDHALQVLEGHVSDDAPYFVTFLKERLDGYLRHQQYDMALLVAQRLQLLKDEEALWLLDKALTYAGQWPELIKRLQQEAKEDSPQGAYAALRLAHIHALRLEHALACQILLQVPQAFRHEKWAELAWSYGRHAPQSKAAWLAAQYHAQHSKNASDEAYWLREAAHRLWWDHDEQDQAKLLLRKAQNLQPLSAQDVLHEADPQLLQEALAVLEDSQETIVLWCRLSTQRQHRDLQKEDLLHAWRLASQPSSQQEAWLKQVLQTAETLEQEDIQWMIWQRLYRLTPHRSFGPYKRILEKTQRFSELCDVLVEYAQHLQNDLIAVSMQESSSETLQWLSQDLKEQQHYLAKLWEEASKIAYQDLQQINRALQYGKMAVQMFENLQGILWVLRLSNSAKTYHDSVLYGAKALLLLDRSQVAHRQEILDTMLQSAKEGEMVDALEKILRQRLEEDLANLDDKAQLANYELQAQAYEKAACLLQEVAQQSTDPQDKRTFAKRSSEAWLLAGDKVAAALILQQQLAHAADDIAYYRLLRDTSQEQSYRLEALKRLIALKDDSQWPFAEQIQSRLDLASQALSEQRLEEAEAYLQDVSSMQVDLRWARLLEQTLEAAHKPLSLAWLWLDHHALFEAQELAPRLEQAAQDFFQAGLIREALKARQLRHELQAADFSQVPFIFEASSYLLCAEDYLLTLKTYVPEQVPEDFQPSHAKQQHRSRQQLWKKRRQQLLLQGFEYSRLYQAEQSQGIVAYVMNALWPILQKRTFVDFLPASSLQSLYSIYYQQYHALLNPYEQIDLLHALLKDCCEKELVLLHGPQLLGLYQEQSHKQPSKRQAYLEAARAMFANMPVAQLVVPLLQLEKDAGCFTQVVDYLCMDLLTEEELFLQAKPLLFDSNIPAMEKKRLMDSIAQAYGASLLGLYNRWQMMVAAEDPLAVYQVLHQLVVKAADHPWIDGKEHRFLRRCLYEVASQLHYHQEATYGFLALCEEEAIPQKYDDALQAFAALPLPKGHGTLWHQLSAVAMPFLEALLQRIANCSSSSIVLLADLIEALAVVKNDNAVFDQLALLLFSYQRQHLAERFYPRLLKQRHLLITIEKDPLDLYRYFIEHTEAPLWQSKIYLAIAEYFENKEHWQQANEAFTKAYELHADGGVALLWGMFCYRQKHFQQAYELLVGLCEQTAYNQACLCLEENQPWEMDWSGVFHLPSYESILWAASQSAQQQSFMEKSLHLAQQLLERQPHLSHVWQHIYQLQLEAQNPLQAIDALQQMLALLPQSDLRTEDLHSKEETEQRFEILQKLGELCLQENKAQEASYYLLEAIYLQSQAKLHEEGEHLVALLLRAYEAAGNHQAYLQIRQEQLQALPQKQWLQGYMDLACFAEDRGAQETAIALWEKALELAPRNRRILQALMQFYQQRHDLPAYLLCAERLLAILPEEDLHVPWLMEVAQSYTQVDVERSQSLYEKALHLDSNYSFEIFQRKSKLALSCHDMWTYTRMQELLIDFEEENAQKINRYIELSKIYQHTLGNMALALQVLHKALAIDTTHPKVLQLLADGSMEQGDLQAAEGYYCQLLQKRFHDADLLLLTARLKNQLRQIDGAYILYATLLALQPDHHEAKEFVKRCRQQRRSMPKRSLLDSERKTLQHSKVAGVIEDFIVPLAQVLQLPILKQLPHDSEHLHVPLSPSEKEDLLAMLPILQTCYLQDAKLLSHADEDSAWCQITYEETLQISLCQSLLDAKYQRQALFLVAATGELYRSHRLLLKHLSSAQFYELLCLLKDIVQDLFALDDDKSSAANARKWLVEGSERRGIVLTLEDIENWRWMLSRKIDLSLRKKLQEVSKIFAKEGDLEALQQWRSASFKTAYRTAMLLTCDAAEAVEALLLSQGIALEDRQIYNAMLHEDPYIQDILQFAVSETYSSMRKRLGLALKYVDKIQASTFEEAVS